MADARLEQTARELVAKGKGILAADESDGTIKKRFAKIGVENTEDNRRAYRDMLFTTPGAEEFISGVILFDETIRQKSLDGTPFPELLAKRGVIPGIKVDTGAKELAKSPEETVTEGLDGLRGRFEAYVKLGARFAKWRGVYTIKGNELPTRYAVDVNAHALARYATLAQECGLVPIVEPEVLMDGDHTIERAYQVTTDVLQSVFAELYDQRVRFEEMLLKPNMVLSGYSSKSQAGVKEVAEATVACLKATVPSAVPGIVFLSGGQTDELATAHLNAMNQLGDLPWELSFSYGRALQAPSLQAWGGKTANVDAGKAAYLKRARLNGAARFGKYTDHMEAA
ncbi:MAG: class I fructose-bisphosphate aldolase [Actinomycetota bacterium]